ncbi:chain length-determining protein [Methylonatrum kenyense]|uniref:XrtA system polysaccharide chain length determinant n=1 Tax=Methylonatrum kenyense TaxID=455253 RepID=UPI0020C01AB5|nr:XrtA system polysaccharide chain length determinant [Methylonatrum kenyense]MCK8516772.1 chain length-determining protein [Methylonatrum kenyense]
MHELYTYILGELRGTWRFRWFALVIVFLVSSAGAYVVLTMPDEYRVQARVQVDTQSMLEPLLANLAVSPNLNARVQALTTTLLNRENLERIANDADLMLAARSEVEQERLLRGLAQGINISGSRNNLYQIAYTNSNPEKAQQVVQAVVDIMTEKTLGMTLTDSATATGFLERQVAEYENRLRTAEQRLADFKRENMGLLPEQGGRDYYGRLRGAEETLEELESNLRTAANRRDRLQQEIAALESGRQSETVPNPRLTVLDEQIRRGNEQLDELLLRYTEAHPDVIALQGQIERQQAERDRVAAEPQPTTRANLSANPVYQELRIRLNDWNGEIAAIEARISDQRNRIRNLQAQVDEITDVEARLADLNRNYEVTRDRYQTLLSRLSTAEMSTEADTSGGQFQFRLIDPPVRPVEAAGPPRDFYILALLPISFGIGGAFAFFLHQIRPVFHTRQLLSDLTGRPVLGSVSLAMTQTQRHMKLIGFSVFSLVALTLIGMIGATALYADVAAAQLQTLMRNLPI